MPPLLRRLPSLAVAVLLLMVAGVRADEKPSRDEGGVPALTEPQALLSDGPPDARGHSVHCLAFAPDGKSLAAGSGNGVVSVWNVFTGKAVVLTMAEGATSICALAYSADGRTLAALDPDGTAHVWDVAREKEMATFDVKGDALALALSPDGKRLAVGTESGDVSLWAVSHPNVRLILKGPGDAVRALAFSRDGKRLAVGDYDGRCQVLDLASNRAVLARDVGARIVGLTFRRDTPFALGWKASALVLVDLETNSRRTLLAGRTPRIHDVAFAPGGNLVAVAGYRSSAPPYHPVASICDLATGREKVVLRDRSNSTTAVAFAPDGRTLATGDEDGTVQLWHLPDALERVAGFDSTGVPLFRSPRTFKGHKGAINSLAFSRDGKLLASGGEDGTVRIWEAVHGQPHFPFRFSAGHRFPLQPPANGRVVDPAWMGRPLYLLRPEAGKSVPVFVVRFGGHVLAALHTDGVVRLWDPATGTERGTIDHARPAYTLAISADGKTLAVGGTRGFITVWDVETRKRRALLDRHETLITTLAFSPNGKRLYSGDRAANCVGWDAEEATAKKQMELPSRARAFGFARGDVLALCSPDWSIQVADVPGGLSRPILVGRGLSVSEAEFSPGADLLAVAGWSPVGPGREALVKLWDVRGKRERAILLAAGSSVESVAFAPNGRTLASGSDDGTVQLWDLPHPGEWPLAPRVLASSTASDIRDNHGAIVHALAYSPDGKTLASGGADKTIKLWETRNLELRGTLAGHTGEVRAVAFAPDGKTVASGSLDRTVRLWDLATRKTLMTLGGHTGVVLSVAFAPDGSVLAVGLSDGRTFVWDAHTGKRRAVLTGHRGPVYGVAFSPDGKTVISASADGRVKLWDVAREKEIAELAHNGPVRAFALSKDGKSLAVGGRDGVLHLWDLPKRTQRSEQRNAGPLVWALAFAPDGRTLASASLEGGVKLWTVRPNGRLVAEALLPGGAEAARCVVFAPDGRTLASASGGTVRLWPWGQRPKSR